MDQRVLGEVWAQRRYIVPGLVCSGLAASLLALYAPLVSKVVMAVNQRDVMTLTWLSAAVMVLFGIRYWFVRGQLYFLGIASNRLTADLRIRVFAKLQRLPLQYFNERRAGAIQSVLTNDVNVYQSAVGAIRDSIDGPIKIISGFVTIFILNWQLALAACAVLPLMAIAIQRNARRMHSAQAAVQRDLGDLTAMMQETLSGARVVKAFGAEERVSTSYEGHVTRTFESQRRAVLVTSTLRPLVELIGAVAVALVVLLCGQLVIRNALHIGQLAAFILMLDVINQGARNVGSLNQTMAQVKAASDRIYENVLNVEDAPGAEEGSLVLENPKGRIEFRDVCFTYPDGTEALHHVSFVLEPGTSVALVGPSGAGKSTIADLLLRFFDPTSGQVLFDGVDLRELETKWLRAQFGVVPQQTFLFAGPISENIRLGAPDADARQVEEAARAAHAHDFIESTPRGYETELGERGVRLSGGEGQRLAIARAIARNPRVLLLDEATSNLDAVSEKAVTSALEEIMRTRTTLFIAHRLTTAARATKIVVLRAGEVVESGSHESLMAADGAYAAMYRAFVSGVLETA